MLLKITIIDNNMDGSFSSEGIDLLFPNKYFHTLLPLQLIDHSGSVDTKILLNKHHENVTTNFVHKLCTKDQRPNTP